MKDCEHIGYILSRGGTLNELLEGIFAMDARIEPEYRAFEEVRGRSEDVTALANELMIKSNGVHWSMKKKHLWIKTYHECWEEAKKEIHGEDYQFV